VSKYLNVRNYINLLTELSFVGDSPLNSIHYSRYYLPDMLHNTNHRNAHFLNCFNFLVIKL